MRLRLTASGAEKLCALGAMRRFRAAPGCDAVPLSRRRVPGGLAPQYWRNSLRQGAER
jgi:hypothetical protein